MLQRTTLPPLSRPADLRDPWNTPLPENWLESLSRAFRLPHTLKGFLAFSLILVCIASGVTLQLLLSIQTTELQNELIRLERQLSRIERDNSEIVWRIAQNTSLADVAIRAKRLGYIPVDDAVYFVHQTGDQAATATVVHAEQNRVENSGSHRTAEQGRTDNPSRLIAPFIDTVGSGDMRLLPEESQIRNLREDFDRGVETIGMQLAEWSESLARQLRNRFGTETSAQ